MITEKYMIMIMIMIIMCSSFSRTQNVPKPDKYNAKRGFLTFV